VAGLRKIRTHVLVCVHKDCEKRGGPEAARELKRVLREAGRRGSVMFSKVDCFDQCDDAPVMVVYPAGVWYGRVDERCAREIAEKHVIEVGDRSTRATVCKVLRDMRRDGDE
jgi:(2Fe-2S) ferredoxin